MISPVHLNGNLMCAIDTETTGLVPGVNDIIQLCVLPLASDFTPSKEYLPFHMIIQPKRPHNAQQGADGISKVQLAEAITNGIDPWTCVERFGEWFQRLRLPPNKKIVPLGANYNFDLLMLHDLFGGPLSYEEYFRSDFRDVQKTALYLNDVADFMSERIPFPKVKLSYLCSCLGVTNADAHDAMGDCLATAEIYRKLMRYRDHYKPIA